MKILRFGGKEKIQKNPPLCLSASVPSALTPAAAASKSGLIRVISLSIHVHARLFQNERLFLDAMK